MQCHKQKEAKHKNDMKLHDKEVLVQGIDDTTSKTSHTSTLSCRIHTMRLHAVKIYPEQSGWVAQFAGFKHIDCHNLVIVQQIQDQMTC